MSQSMETSDFLAEHCPKCRSRNMHLINAFDFKYRMICLDCGYHTAWHINDPEGAIEEWNNHKPDEIKI